jgi:positive regulator of sigma E activity
MKQWVWEAKQDLHLNQVVEVVVQEGEVLMQALFLIHQVM